MSCSACSMVERAFTTEHTEQDTDEETENDF